MKEPANGFTIVFDVQIHKQVLSQS